MWRMLPDAGYQIGRQSCQPREIFGYESARVTSITTSEGIPEKPTGC